MKRTILMILGGIALNSFAGIDEGIAAYHQGKFEIAYKEFSAASKSGDATGQHLLASLYYQGQGVKQDIQKSVDLFKKAANQNYLPSIANLGVMYMEGTGVEQSYSEAFNYYKKAAELGDLQSIFNVGQFYRKGAGVEQNNEKAAHWYRLAAERGSLGAQNEYGLLFAQGQGVPLDYIQAYAWINMPAEAGDGQAIKNRAQLLQILNEQDELKAKKLAAEYKSKYAMANK